VCAILWRFLRSHVIYYRCLQRSSPGNSTSEYRTQRLEELGNGAGCVFHFIIGISERKTVVIAVNDQRLLVDYSIQYERYEINTERES
jgi:hypothetical protein